MYVHRSLSQLFHSSKLIFNRRLFADSHHLFQSKTLNNLRQVSKENWHLKFEFGLGRPKNVCQRTFHKTGPKQALPPIIWVVIRSVLKFAAVVTGRGLRKWWANLPKNKRAYILNEIHKNRKKIMIVSVLSGCSVYIYYLIHLVEDPVTKRKKFLMFSEKQIRQMAMINYEIVLETYEGQIVTSGQQHKYVSQITHRILQANKDLPGVMRQWQVIIVDNKDTMNAFVLPSGHIFIFTGMLSTVSNDDQLAAIIAHEIAHALLCHSAEIVSKTHLLEMLLLLPLVVLWTLLPGTVAVFSHYFTEYMSAVLFELPFSRKLETEADIVGLEMISRACYDPRQASVFWRKMEKLAENEQIEWLSTHPNHKSRYQTLDSILPNAFSILATYCNKQDMDPHLSRLVTNIGK